MFLADEQQTMMFAQQLAAVCQSGMQIHLLGDLGAGKTTLVRGFVQYFLPGCKVKSPTYTLVEEYEASTSASSRNAVTTIYHFDLYRLADPEELEYLGGRDYFSGDAVCLVEWPQRGEGWLAEPDLLITLVCQNKGRHVSLEPCSDRGKAMLAQLPEPDSISKESR